MNSEFETLGEPIVFNDSHEEKTSTSTQILIRQDLEFRICRCFFKVSARKMNSTVRCALSGGLRLVAGLFLPSLRAKMLAQRSSCGSKIPPQRSSCGFNF
jgi:hypothetical protein